MSDLTRSNVDVTKCKLLQQQMEHGIGAPQIKQI